MRGNIRTGGMFAKERTKESVQREGQPPQEDNGPRVHINTHACTHARTHARARTQTHTKNTHEGPHGRRGSLQRWSKSHATASPCLASHTCHSRSYASGSRATETDKAQSPSPHTQCRQRRSTQQPCAQTRVQPDDRQLRPTPTPPRRKYARMNVGAGEWWSAPPTLALRIKCLGRQGT